MATELITTVTKIQGFCHLIVEHQDELHRQVERLRARRPAEDWDNDTRGKEGPLVVGCWTVKFTESRNFVEDQSVHCAVLDLLENIDEEEKQFTFEAARSLIAGLIDGIKKIEVADNERVLPCLPYQVVQPRRQRTNTSCSFRF